MSVPTKVQARLLQITGSGLKYHHYSSLTDFDDILDFQDTYGATSRPFRVVVAQVQGIRRLLTNPPTAAVQDSAAMSLWERHTVDLVYKLDKWHGELREIEKAFEND
ncbi:MAG: hypothetical protein Q9184_002334, partial [Pyrenodesmia sp. 2 TL-2023]